MTSAVAAARPSTKDSLRIALLSYRGNPYSGGQGVYIHYLSRALAELGHRVEVLSGQPYPQLAAGIGLTRVPSLDLYRAGDPFRTPARKEFRDAIDVLEFASMCTAAFPEPLTFSLRVARMMRHRSSEFDVVHDNQSLGYGLLPLSRRVPTIATVHHPIAIDRRLALEGIDGKRFSTRRWYAFTRMQARVARRLPYLIAPSDAARDDSVRELSVRHDRVRVVPNGVDAELFSPQARIARVPGRVITTTSADVPLKGLVFLIEAVAKLRTERAVELVVVGKAAADGPVAAAIDRLGLRDVVSFRSELPALNLVELYASAEVAVVPSLYEGFSLPAIEAMSCRVPVVATTAGALPEVVGRDGSAALLVVPGDAEALKAAIARLLGAFELREQMGSAARRRVLEHFTWKNAARATEAVYREALA